MGLQKCNGARTSSLRDASLRDASSGAEIDPIYPNTAWAVVLKSHKLSTRLLVGALFFGSLDEFFREPWYRHIWRIWLSSFREIIHSSSPPNPIVTGNFHCHIVPKSISDDSSWAKPFGPPPWMWEKGLSSTNERAKQPLQSHQHKRTEQAEESLGRLGFLGNDRVLEPTKERVEGNSKQEAARPWPWRDVLWSFL